MSLPAAKKAISENPAKDTVTSPTNKQALEADVNRKLKFYGIIQAFRQGRMPDNAQIDETLVYARDHSPVDTAKLSPDGKKLVQDVWNIIETTRLMVKEKNADEVVQQFFYHTSGAQPNGTVSVDAPISGQEARTDGKEALEHLRTLLQLLITNSETRKLLSDFKLIGRDLFAETAASVSERVRPSPEALAGVDDIAPPEKWENMSTSKSGTTTDLKNGAIGANSTSPKTAETTESGTVQQPSAREVPPSIQNGEPTTQKKTFKTRIQNLTGRVPDKHKTRINEDLSDAKKYLHTKFPRERRDQFVYRLKKVIVECQSHPSYQSSLSWLLTQMEVYFGHGRKIATSGANQTNTIFSDPILNQAVSELRTILERCANGESIEPILKAAQKLSEDSQNDEELRAWWSRVDSFVRKSLLEPGFILAPMFETEARRLRDESSKFFDFKYKEHKVILVDAIQSWFGSWAEDSLNQRFTDDWSRLIKDLLFSDDGQLTFKPHLWGDIRQVILPTLIEKVGYVPIPRIEYTDDNLDLVIENLTLQGRNLFPNILELNAQNYVKLSPYASITDEHHHTLTLTLSQIQADMRDVAFYYNKKSGLPRIKDSGLADVFLGGAGITIKVKITSTTKDRAMGTSLYKVKDVSVTVDTLKFAVRDSKHGLLYKTLRPLATSLIKKQIAKAIGDGIRNGLEYADTQLVQVRDRMAAAESSEEISRTQVLKDVFSRSKTDQSSFTEEKALSVKSKRASTFRIVPKKDSMLLPEQGYEKGWIKKQSERDEKAAQGEGWRSKAFSIVPA